MKKVLTLLLLCSFINLIGNCQILNNPSLTVDDFASALTNASQLRNILKKHNFECSVYGETSLVTPEIMQNQLTPDLYALRSEDWEPKNQHDHSIVKVSIYEWKADHAPLPEVMRTIRVIIRRNSSYSDQTREFFESIKDKYPVKGKGYFRNSELYKAYGESYNVFTNDSKIEVRTETEKPIYSRFYIVDFDLIR